MKDRQLPHTNFKMSEAVVSAQYPELASNIILAHYEEWLFGVLVYTILQPARKWLGQPIIITSGKRTRKLNSLINGSPNSDHLYMMAVDFYVEAKDGSVDREATEKVFEWIQINFPYSFGQLIIYRKPNMLARFVHASLPSERHHGEVMEKIQCEEGGKP